MANENDVSPSKHINDENQYNYLKGRLWELMENENFTDIRIITYNDTKFIKNVHSLILDCFCKLPNLMNALENESDSEKYLSLDYSADIIDCIINMLYIGKCIVPVARLTEFMNLANYLNIKEIFVYDERGSDYFIYIMQHKHKLMNYLYYIKKNCVNCDGYVVSRNFTTIPIHRSILAAYSKKILHFYYNRITIKNPVLFYLPSNGDELEKILEFCYFGQVALTKNDLEEIPEVANLLGIDRLLEKGKFVKKKVSFNEDNFTVLKPPENTLPELFENFKKTSSKCYNYLWFENRCYLIPVICFQLLNFNNDYNIFQDYKLYDNIVFFKFVPSNIVKKFIHCIYTWECTLDIKPLIEAFNIDSSYLNSAKPCPLSDTNLRVCNPLYANNLKDLRVICDTVFEEECGEGEMVIQLFTCQICGDQSLSKTAFTAHCQNHQSDRLLCEECGKFICQNNFIEHMRRHFQLKKNQCEKCLRQFRSSFALKRHKMSYICWAEKCTHCKKLVRRDKIKEHIANHDLKFPCTICNRHYKTKEILEKHMKSTLTKCLYCSKIVSPKCRLKQHMIEKHHYLIYPCPICQATFKTVTLLNKHYNRHHLNQQIECNMCSKKFSKLGSLRIHERKHTGEKPYKCKVCNLPFARLDSMYYHIRQDHNKEKYRCPFCGKLYSSKQYFLEHGLRFHGQLLNPTRQITTQIDTVADNEISCLDPDSILDQINKNKFEFDETVLVNQTVEDSINISNINITYGCPICSTSFQNFNELISHLDSHL